MLTTTCRTQLDPKDLSEVQRATLRRILGYLRPCRVETAIVLGAILFQALLGLAPSLSIKLIVDRAIPNHDRAEVVGFAALMIVAPLVAGLLGVLQRYMAAYFAEHVVYALRNQLFRHSQQLSLGYFMTAKPGEVVSGSIRPPTSGACCSLTAQRPPWPHGPPANFAPRKSRPERRRN